MRARSPDLAGTIERNGVSLGYEVHGQGPQTVMLLPTWTIIPIAIW